jgi:hypothetical protein
MQIPGLARTDPNVPRSGLELRLRRIDKRRAEIEAKLTALGDSSSPRSRPESPARVELEAELATLNNLRREAELILRPPKPTPIPALERAREVQRAADISFLRAEIIQQTAIAEAAAQKLEAAGEHRQARLQRSLIPELPERLCREFGKDPALLAEIDE